LADALGIGAPDRRGLSVYGDDVLARHACAELEGDDFGDHWRLLGRNGLVIIAARDARLKTD
jgi:hypothetical protein